MNFDLFKVCSPQYIYLKFFIANRQLQNRAVIDRVRFANPNE